MPKSKTQDAKLERGISYGPLAEEKGKDRGAKRHLIRFTSYRIRLLDSENLCSKWFTDALRYARIIPDDRPEDVEIEIWQKKVKAKAEEVTIIEIEEL